jgi:ABC-type glycerol-3-phosphate transport system substrate-binding protein
VNRHLDRRLIGAATVTVALLLAACGDDDTSTSSTTAAATATTTASSAPSTPPATKGSITLVTYESWPDTMDAVLGKFTAQTGIGVKVV